MTARREPRRGPSSWAAPFDYSVLALGLVPLGWVLYRVVGMGWDARLGVALLVGAPAIAVLARFPITLSHAGGRGVEVCFDTTVLIFLLSTVDTVQALAVWALGLVVSELAWGKGGSMRAYVVGAGTLAGGAAGLVVHLVRGPADGSPRELLAVVLAALVYLLLDYVFTSISFTVDSEVPLVDNVVQPGQALAMASFLSLTLLAYLAALVLRYAPWWPAVVVVAVPVGTLLVAGRLANRGSVNARRLTALLTAAVRSQTLFDAEQVLQALESDARELLRPARVTLRRSAPGDGEIGSQVVRGTDATWLVTPGRPRVHESMADQQALDALAAIAADALARLKLTGDMVHFARHDPLTDLPNRGILMDRVTHALQLARRRRTSMALLFVDLDGFKPVNDRFGHAVGDRVLIQVAKRMRVATRASDTVARLGGDEFAVLLEDIDSDAAVALGKRILRALAEPILAGDATIQLGASVGVAFADEESTTESLLRHADLAMYEAKANGKGRVVEYDGTMGSSRLEKLELTDRLRQAVRNREITVVYQPVVDATTGRIEGVEALARWQLDGRPIPPDVFIPLAEETGLIVELGELVLGLAARDALHLRTSAGRPISMSVNVSAQQLRDPCFVEVVGDAVVAMGDIQLVLEITEREGIGGDSLAMASMRSIHAMGVLFAIDDFGVGFSSVGYLQDVPAQILKADRTLSRNIDRDDRACVLLRAVAKMGAELGMDVVVEGIERESQLVLVRDEVLAPLAQGYLMHRPMPLARLLDLVAELGRAVARAPSVPFGPIREPGSPVDAGTVPVADDPVRELVAGS